MDDFFLDVIGYGLLGAAGALGAGVLFSIGWHIGKTLYCGPDKPLSVVPETAKDDDFGSIEISPRLKGYYQNRRRDDG